MLIFIRYVFIIRSQNEDQIIEYLDEKICTYFSFLSDRIISLWRL